MYLYMLNEEEQFAFLNLCTEIMKVSGCPYEKQKKIINEYCNECNTFYIHYADLNNISDPELIYKDSDYIAKKIAVFEALALAYSDNILEKSEDEVIKVFAEKIGISDCYDKIRNTAKKYMKTYNEIEDYINS